MANNNCAGNLLRAVQMYGFYVKELNLYLDTHPNDKKALEMLKAYISRLNIATKAYADKYDPITVEQSDSETHFSWVDAPWPWERSAN